MCGIVGVLSFIDDGLAEPDVKIFHQLWKASVLRGEDGAGLFWVGDEKSGMITENHDPVAVSWLKKAGTPYDVYQTKEWGESEWELGCSRFVIGHNRFKTIGEASTDNAHPFGVNHITMVHNGTIGSIDGVKGFHKHATDSLALCTALAENPDAVEVLRNINGAAAVVWYDENKQTLNLYRNRERPLTFNYQWNRYYIASEASMLRWVLARNDWTNKSGNKEALTISMMKENTLFEFTHLNDIPKEYPVERIIVQVPAMAPIFRRKQRNPGILPPVVSPIVGPAANDAPKEPKVRKYVPTKKYFGLHVGDTVIFESCNIEFLNNKENHAHIDGIFHGIQNRIVPNMGQLVDIQIRCKVQRNKKEEITNLYNEPFLKGKVVSINVDTNDISDIIVYLVDIKPVSKTEMEIMIKANNILSITKKMIHADEVDPYLRDQASGQRMKMFQ